MRPKIARQGFALITAVIISAAILATIVGIAVLTVRETAVQADQSASDQALAVAERGLADFVSRFNASDQILVNQANTEPGGVVWQPSFSSGTTGTVNLGGHAFYWVKVIPQGAANTTGSRDYVVYVAGFLVRPEISALSSDDLKTTLAGSTTDVIARRIVRLTGTKPQRGAKAVAFDYGLFTGGTFKINGGKNLSNFTATETSGFYAAKDIQAPDAADSFTNLPLTAQGNINLSKNATRVNSPVNPGYNQIPLPTFPQLDLESYMDLFDDFVANPAKKPFDGTVSGYPDLSVSAVRTAVLTALGDPENNVATMGGQQHHFVTPGNLSSYTDAVANGTLPGLSSYPDALSQLKSTLSKSVFYVRNSTTDADAKWQSDRADLAGVVVCSGAVTFSGCPDFPDGQELALLAGGNIDIQGNNKNVPCSGFFYSEGTVKYTGGSSFTGQIISQLDATLGGSGSVTFRNYASDFTEVLLPAVPFSARASGWTEGAWNDFVTLPVS